MIVLVDNWLTEDSSNTSLYIYVHAYVNVWSIHRADSRVVAQSRSICGQPDMAQSSRSHPPHKPLLDAVAERPSNSHRNRYRMDQADQSRTSRVTPS